MGKVKVSKNNNTKKIVCSVAIAVAAALIIFAFCGRFFNSVFRDIANFFVGSFGMAFYGMMIAVIVCCSFLLAGKSVRIPVKYVVHFCLLFVEIVLLVHMFSTVFLCYGEGGSMISFKEYAGFVYNYYSGVPTFGGIVFGMIAYGLQRVITIYGAAVVLFGLLAWSVIVTGDFFYSYFTGKIALSKPAEVKPSQPPRKEEEAKTPQSERERAFQILFSGESSLAPEEVKDSYVAPKKQEEQPPKPKQPTAEEILFGDQVNADSFFKPAKQQQPQQPQQQIQDDYPDTDVVVPGFYVAEEEEEKPVEEDNWRIAKTEHVEQTEQTATPKGEWVTRPMEESIDFAQVAAEEEPLVRSDIPEQTYSADDEQTSEQPEDGSVELVPVEKVKEVPGGMQVGFEFQPKAEVKKAEEKVHRYPKYVKPSLDLLEESTDSIEDDAQARAEAAQGIVNKLAVFGIKVEDAGQIVGPTVTRYLFKVLSQKTRMDQFKQYSADIKACLAAEDEIIIEAPVQGTNLVGIEVANKVRAKVMLRSMLESKEFQTAKGSLVFVVGQQISGEMIVADLAKLPHLLVAGTTGSGKSVFLNTLIVSLMYRYGPEYLRFIMVDPKFVELSRYNGIPHMLTSETITAANDALAGMDYLISEMEARYQLFRQTSVGNIGEYNAKINPKIQQKLPYLVLIVDELADLMTVSQKNFESKLQRLAQKSRAAGIHIVLATQRPDVKTITGTVKTNLPARVAFKVSSPQDSMTILSVGGAEKLLGNGDMLYVNPSKAGMTRAQGAFISNEEIKQLVDYVASQNEVYYDEKISQEIFLSRQQPQEEVAEPAEGEKEKPLDPYCKKALRYWLEHNGGKASIASIQRSLQIGFNRAGRILESLQRLNYVESLKANETSTKPVKVLVTLEELDSLFPDMED